jgi:hypothetical protein
MAYDIVLLVALVALLVLWTRQWVRNRLARAMHREDSSYLEAITRMTDAILPLARLAAIVAAAAFPILASALLLTHLF